MKRKFEIGRPAANTKIGVRRVRTVRVRGGNLKARALRLNHGNFAWASEHTTRKARIIDVVYNASNNELVRTKTLVKNCIVLIDSGPFRQWYESHYAATIGKRKATAKVSRNSCVMRYDDFYEHDEHTFIHHLSAENLMRS